MVANAENNDKAGTSDDLELLAMFNTAGHALTQEAMRYSCMNKPVLCHGGVLKGHNRWGYMSDHLWRNCPRREDPEIHSINRKEHDGRVVQTSYKIRFFSACSSRHGRACIHGSRG